MLSYNLYIYIERERERKVSIHAFLAHTHTHTCACTLHTHTCTHTHIPTHTRTHTHTHTHIYIYIYIERERDVCWLVADVPATCECISGTDLLNFMCCHTEIDVADQTFHLTQSQYTDTGPTSPSTDPIMPGASQGSHWSANF